MEAVNQTYKYTSGNHQAGSFQKEFSTLKSVQVQPTLNPIFFLSLTTLNES